jgi:hypothetical protein
MAANRSARWQRSSHSMGNGNCVEITRLPSGQVGVRDSKDPDGGMLQLTPGQWRGLVASIKEPGAPWSAELGH